MGLAKAMVRVLPKDHDLDLVERGQVEGPEIVPSLGEDTLSRFLLAQQEAAQFAHVRIAELGRQRLSPPLLQSHPLHHGDLYWNRPPRCSTSIL